MKFAVMHECDLENVWDNEQAATSAAVKYLGEQGNDEPYVVVQIKSG